MREGWRKFELGAVIELTTGFAFRSDSYSDRQEDIRLLRGDNVVHRYIRWDDAKRWPLQLTDGLRQFELRVGDIVVALDRTWVKGGVKVSSIREMDLPALLVQRVARIRCLEDAEQGFIEQHFYSHRFEQMCISSKTETAVPHLSPNDIRSFQISLPPLLEQRKIVEILRTWDEAIEKLEALLVAKTQMFVAQTTDILERSLRHVDQRRKASELFEPVSERGRTELPLLAVMQDKGVVRREDLERRVVMPEGGNDAYKAVRPGDFIISLRSFEGGLELSQIEGLVSPAYTVIRSNQLINASYYSAYFKSRSFIGRVDAMVYGIRDGKQISFRDFGDMLLPNPPLDKQARDAKIFDAARAEVELLAQQIDALKTQKRGLMQKLLTGEWRVEVTTSI
jgi:type I restriction enzyme S subunit